MHGPSKRSSSARFADGTTRTERKRKPEAGDSERHLQTDQAMNRRERIIELTMRMFVSQGIKSVRMDDIAQQLGVSKRTLYDYFDDKEQLLYEAMACYAEQSRLRWAKARSGARNVLEALFMVLGEIMDHSETDGRMMENLRRCYPAVYGRLMGEGSERNRQEFRDMLEEGIAEGFFVDTINVDLAISVLYYSASALVVHRDLALPGNISERDALVQIVSTFFRGISTARGLELIDDFLKRREAERKRRQEPERP